MEALTVLLILFLGGICLYMFYTGPVSFLTFILLFAILAFILVHFKFITIDISKSKELGIDFTGQPVPPVSIGDSKDVHPVRDFFECMENFITGRGWYTDEQLAAVQKAVKSANTIQQSTQQALAAAKSAQEQAEAAAKAAKIASDEAGKITPDTATMTALSPASCNISVQDRFKDRLIASDYVPELCKENNALNTDAECTYIAPYVLSVIDPTSTISSSCNEYITALLTSEEADSVSDKVKEDKCSVEVGEFMKTLQKTCASSGQPTSGAPIFDGNPHELSLGLKFT